MPLGLVPVVTHGQGRTSTVRGASVGGDLARETCKHMEQNTLETRIRCTMAQSLAKNGSHSGLRGERGN
jgi:hypothetical protein